MRQSDRKGIYFKFGKLLKPKIKKENKELKINKDSPFSFSMFIMFEFKDHEVVDQIFDYISTNETLMNSLKVINESMMICSNICIDSDLNLLSLSFLDSENFNLKQSTKVNGILENEETSNKNYKWAKKKKFIDNFEKNQKSFLLKIEDFENILPPNFKNLNEDVKKFTEILLLNGKLLPFQLTVGLIGALSIAETIPSISRAKSLLYELTKHPSTQLSNIHSIARYILGDKEKEKEDLKKEDEFLILKPQQNKFNSEFKKQDISNLETKYEFVDSLKYSDDSKKCLIM
jgi:hypothetical protein